MLARFRVTTTEKIQMVDITKEILEIISQANIDSGICTIFCAHTTAGITLTELGDIDSVLNITDSLNHILSTGGGLTIDNRATAHIKTMFTGNSINIIVSEGRALLGNWQGVYLCEFDGGNSRTIFVKVTKD